MWDEMVTMIVIEKDNKMVTIFLKQFKQIWRFISD